MNKRIIVSFVMTDVYGIFPSEKQIVNLILISSTFFLFSMHFFSKMHAMKLF